DRISITAYIVPVALIVKKPQLIARRMRVQEHKSTIPAAHVAPASYCSEGTESVWSGLANHTLLDDARHCPPSHFPIVQNYSLLFRGLWVRTWTTQCGTQPPSPRTGIG